MKTKFDKLTIHSLTNEIIRFEFCPNNEFSNQESLFVPFKKEDPKPLQIVEQDKVSFEYAGFAFVFDKTNPLETLEVFEGDQLVYKYHEIKNSGELPFPNKTPKVFPLMDSPRLLIPDDGYVANNQGFVLQKDVKDLYLLLCNNDYLKLRRQFISLTGRNELPRLKNFGLFSSRYYKYSQKTAMEMINNYAKHKIPLDNFVVDTDWRDMEKLSGCGYTINEKLFPNMQEFFRFAHKNNIQVIVNDHPLPLNETSNVLDNDEIDYRNTNLTKMLKMGLDGWWYDRNWICSLNSVDKNIVPETLGNYLFNDVIRQFNQGFTLDPEVYYRSFVMSNINNIRNGNYKGMLDSTSHKYSLQWSGDTWCDEYTLKNEIINLNKCANNMLGLYSSDIGGHIGDPTKTQYTRWFQYGAFSPVLRPHCTCSVKKFREPWNYDKKTLEICKNYINMRYRLLNVFYTAAFKNVDSGLGVCSPLYLYNPTDKKAYKEETSYLINNQILVSPITGVGKEKSLNKDCFVEKPKVYIYPNAKYAGKAFSKPINSLKDVESYFKKIKAKCKKSKQFSIKIKGILYFKQEYQLSIKNFVGVKIAINKKVIFDDRNCHYSTCSPLTTIKKNRKYPFEIEFIQNRRYNSVDIVYYKLLKNNKNKVYLPEGEWFNMFHRNVYQGKHYIKEKYKVDETPVFVRAGSLLALYKTIGNISTMSLKNIVYDYYTSKKEDVKDFFYEDDGITTGYRIGEYRKNEYRTHYEEGKYIIELFGTNKLMDDSIISRNVVFKAHIRDGEFIEQVLINGEPVKFKRHDHTKKFIPFLSDEFAKDSKTLTFKFKQNIKDTYKIELIIRK